MRLNYSLVRSDLDKSQHKIKDLVKRDRIKTLPYPHYFPLPILRTYPCKSLQEILMSTYWELSWCAWAKPTHEVKHQTFQSRCHRQLPKRGANTQSRT